MPTYTGNPLEVLIQEYIKEEYRGTGRVNKIPSNFSIMPRGMKINGRPKSFTSNSSMREEFFPSEILDSFM